MKHRTLKIVFLLKTRNVIIGSSKTQNWSRTAHWRQTSRIAMLQRLATSWAIESSKINHPSVCTTSPSSEQSRYQFKKDEVITTHANSSNNKKCRVQLSLSLSSLQETVASTCQQQCQIVWTILFVCFPCVWICCVTCNLKLTSIFLIFQHPILGRLTADWQWQPRTRMQWLQLSPEQDPRRNQWEHSRMLAS